MVTAGLTVPSSTRLLADQVAEATSAQVTARGESVELDFIELREVAGELATFMVTGGIPTPRAGLGCRRPDRGHARLQRKLDACVTPRQGLPSIDIEVMVEE